LPYRRGTDGRNDAAYHNEGNRTTFHKECPENEEPMKGSKTDQNNENKTVVKLNSEIGHGAHLPDNG
jgi:hypothetical protein